MSNLHLPAGRAVQGGPPGPAGMGIAEMPLSQMAGDRHGAAPGGVGPGATGNGGPGGRSGGGRGRGRHYHNYHNNHSRHAQQHSQQHNQFGQQHHALGQPQIYPNYIHPFPPTFAYAPPMPHYAQAGGMPTGFVPYQQPYGRPMAAMPQYPPMMAPGMPPMPPAGGVHHLPPHAQHPHQQAPHLQHLSQPHMTTAYPRHEQQTPVIVSTPQPQLPPPPPPSLPPVRQLSPPEAPPDSFLPAMPTGSLFNPNIPPLNAPLSPHTNILPPPVMQAPLQASMQPPILPQTPSSTHSSQAIPTPMSPSVSTARTEPALSTDSAADAAAESAAALATLQHLRVHLPPTPNSPSSDARTVVPTLPFRPPVSRPARANIALQFGDVVPPVPADYCDVIQLPWLSRPDLSFPTRRNRSRRRRREMGGDIELPQNPTAAALEDLEKAASPETPKTQAASAVSPITPQSANVPVSTPALSKPSPAKSTPTVSSKAAGGASRPAIPAVPILPVIPIRNGTDKPSDAGQPAAGAEEPTNGAVDGETPPAKLIEAGAPAPLPPKLWTGLFSKSSAAAKAAPAGAHAGPNGTDAANGQVQNGVNGTDNFSKSKANSLAEALSAFRVGSSDKVAFIEPRGLINTGNMCYMNSVLQALIFCVPFYDFLDQVSKKAAYSFKSETPMLDAMIMFIREFKVIDAADSVDLRRRLKSDDIERYGEAFTPEFVYEAIKHLSRFSGMRRGHQQDAEEFLGFVLECLNDECTKVMQGAAAISNGASTQNSGIPTPAASVTSEVPDASGGDGWLEVGPRQRPAVTQSSGHISASPVYSTFGGLLRSVLSVPGRKDSITFEAYQALPLHIDSTQVRNIADALRALTKPEIIRGDFGSPHSKDVAATKQVFIETLPPMLILHLKQFQYDWEGNRTIKIGKKIGYPLELEIPREIFSRRKRNGFLSEPLPKYRLNAVVYHHGKYASGGHYTVDVLREDGREWIRLDDTVIRRIRSEDVAEAGAEEASSGRPESQSNSYANGNRRDVAPLSTNGSSNRFAGIEDDEGGNENDWREVTGPANGTAPKWSSVANGTANKGKPQRDSVKDNKVAYLLFYQRIN